MHTRPVPHESELGQFLQTYRARLRPEDVGLVPFGERRRVPGLRREELAGLAGVSPSYYARLEQGQSPNASSQVLRSIASALRLDEYEQAHLFDLARPVPSSTTSSPPPERLLPATYELVQALGDTPVLVTGALGDVLMWNRGGHALFAAHLDPTSPDRPDDRPNTARMLFLDPNGRDLWVDWAGKARAVVEHLRMVSGRRHGDRRLHQLVGELTTGSEEFAALWADHGVKACSSARYELRHPLVGTVTLTQQSLTSATTPDQSVVVFTARPNSRSEAALRRLAGASLVQEPARGAQGTAAAPRAGLSTVVG